MYTYSKNKRLLSRREFTEVFQEAKKISGKGFLLFFRRNNLETARLGLIIAKKQVKLANDRNRIKRIIRESFRHYTSLPRVDVIVMVYKTLNDCSNEEIRQRLEEKWQEIIRLSQKHSNAC